MPNSEGAKDGTKDVPKKDAKPKRKSVIEDNLMLNVIKKYMKYAGGVSVVWAMGYFGISVSWLWIALVPWVMRDRIMKAKQHKTAIAQEIAKNEKSVILARVEDLPSWVNFPDVERAEWVNKIIRQMWPYIGEMVEKILRENVEPSVRDSLPAALKSFTFSTIDLGDIPLRTGGVKVYSHIKRNEIYMDLEINYSGDCDIAVAIRGIQAGIRDLRLHGTLRVVFKPLINRPPLIGGMRVFFLNNPELDFDLTSLANAFDIPGLSDMLRSIVIEQIANLMVLPNVFPIKLAEGIDLNKLKYPQPQGVVRITVVEAKDLIAADIAVFGKGSSDPYVVLRVGAKTVKTSVKSKSLSPVWNETFEMIVDSADGQLLYLDVFDDDQGSKDDELGRVNMDLTKLKDDGFSDAWLQLEDVKQGAIHLNLTWLWLANDPQELGRVLGIGQVEQDIKQDENLEEDKTHSAILLVFLDSAANLPRAKKSLQEPSPQATLKVGQQIVESAVKQTTNEPRWEQNFRFMLQNPNYQNLEVEIKDTKSKQKIGETTIKIKELLSAEDMVMDQRFHIQTSEADSTISMRLALRILTPRANPEWTETEESVAAAEAEESAQNNNDDAAEKKEAVNGKPAQKAPEPVVEEVTSKKSDQAAQEAKLRAETEAKEKAEREAKEKSDRDAKQRAEREAKEKADRDAKQKAEREAKEKAEREAKAKAEQEAKLKAEKEAKLKAEEAAKAKAKQSETEKRVEEVKLKSEAELDKDVHLETEPKAEDATLFASDNFSPDADCEVISKAISKTFGADEAAIIEVLSKRSQEQRQQIAVTYKTKYGKELPKELSKKLSGNFKNLCVDMMSGPAEFDAMQLYKAMKGLGSDEQVLVEIICSRSNEQLNAIKQTYKELYGKELEAAVIDDTSGDFQRLLVGCLQAKRPEGTQFDRNRARQDAQDLHQAGEKTWGTNESSFQRVLLTRSFAQLRATFQEYAKVANKDIEDTIKDEMGSDLKDGMLTIVRVIRGKPKYFAKALYKSMKGLGTDDDTLVRVVASRCEVDMVQIKEEFQKEYGKTLGSFIADDCTGDYRKMLLALIGDPDAKR